MFLCFMDLKVCSLHSVVCVFPPTLKDSSLLIGAALFLFHCCAVFESFAYGTLSFRACIALGTRETFSRACMQLWDGQVKGMPSFLRRAESVYTFHQPHMSVSVASFLPQHLVFSHFKFFVSDSLWRKKSLYLLAASTSSLS